MTELGKVLITDDFFDGLARSACLAPQSGTGDLVRICRTAAIWRNSGGRFGASFRELREECLSFVIPPKHGDPADGHEDSK